MAVPKFWKLMLPLLKIAAGGETQISDARTQLAQVLNLTDEDVSALLPSGRQTYLVNRTSWARIYLEKAGLLETTGKARFKITDAGRALLAENPAEITNDILKRFPSYVEWKHASRSVPKTDDPSEPGQDAEVSDTNPEEQMEEAYAALRDALKADIMDRLLSLTPEAFERVIVDLLVGMGYGGGRAEMGKAIGRSGDEGVDGVINEDTLGLDRVYIQAKKYARDKSVGRPAVQAFVGSLEGFNASKGILATTSYFTSEAESFVAKISKRIILIDGERLASLMIKHGVGVREKNALPILRIDEDFFSD